MPLLADATKAEEIALAAVMRVKARAQRQDDPRILRWRADPVAWVKERLGEFLWSKQRDILESVRDNRRTAVPSAHETGKSFTASRAVCWWLDTHPVGEAFVVTTATTGAQVRAILWREIGRAHRKGQLAGRTNQTEWWIDEEMVAFGRKPADYDPTAFQGIHARYVLVVIDEACGVPETIYQAANSLAANEHSRILAIGNPDDASSHFATICGIDSGWNVVQVDGLQSPNFTDEEIPDGLRDLLISPVYIAELKGDVGEDSPIYASKARGQFPQDTENGVVPLSFVRKCQDPEQEWPESAALPVELGVDVGAGGDETVIRERRGVHVGRTWRYRTPDWAQAVGYVVQAIGETGATCVKVDTIGIGWGVVGRLKELRDMGNLEADVVPVNVGEASSQPERFPKLRDEIWWSVGRELSRDHGWDLRDLDDRTIAQLVAPTYAPDSAGRIKVEPKDKTRERLGRSPDDADALLLAFYRGRRKSVFVA